MSLATRMACGLLALGAMGCASARFDGHVFSKSDVVYEVGALPPEWLRLDISGGDLAFRHRDGGAILVNATCADIDDLPLDVLTNHLLFGVTDQHAQGRTTVTLDGREALQTQLEGAIDGVAVQLLLVVVKKNGCTFDLQLAAGAHQFSARRADFARFLAVFAKRERR